MFLTAVVFVLVVVGAASSPARVADEKGQALNGATIVPHFASGQQCPEFPVQNTSTTSAIVAQCFYFLKCHEVTGEKFGKSFKFYRPSLEKYGPDQWLWDSCAHQIALSHNPDGGPDDAEAALRTLFSMQKQDGRVPEMIFWSDSGVLGEILNYLEWSSPESADLTQMPLPPYSLRAIYNKTRSKALLKEFIPKIVKYYDWWHSARSPDGDDLVIIIHGWESGLDASPVYDPAYGVNDPRPSFEHMYAKFIELVLDYSYRYEWNQTEIVERKKAPFDVIDGYFLVKDVGVNSVYAAGWGILAELAHEIDDDVTAKHCLSMQIRIESAIIKRMWSQPLQRFISLYRDRDGIEQESTVEAVQSLFPLLLSSLPRTLADSIVRTQLTNTSKFWLRYPIPSVSASAAEFEPTFTVDLMWRGPTWPMLNWLVMEGLGMHGYTPVQDSLLRRWIALYEQSGVWEQYNPLTGDAYGAVGLGMSTLIVDWIYRMGLLQS